jgi:hypothetical protein
MDKKLMYKCFIVLICLLIAGSSANGVMLCFGADGHFEIESAFHERCDDHAHSQSANQKQLSYRSGHAKDRHCQPCVDIPVTIGLAKIGRVSKQLNSTSSAQATIAIVLASRFNNSAYNSASCAFDAASRFTPLRGVILLI